MKKKNKKAKRKKGRIWYLKKIAENQTYSRQAVVVYSTCSIRLIFWFLFVFVLAGTFLVSLNVLNFVRWFCSMFTYFPVNYHHCFSVSHFILTPISFYQTWPKFSRKKTVSFFLFLFLLLNNNFFLLFGKMPASPLPPVLGRGRSFPPNHTWIPSLNNLKSFFLPRPHQWTRLPSEVWFMEKEMQNKNHSRKKYSQQKNTVFEWQNKQLKQNGSKTVHFSLVSVSFSCLCGFPSSPFIQNFLTLSIFILFSSLHIIPFVFLWAVAQDCWARCPLCSCPKPWWSWCWCCWRLCYCCRHSAKTNDWIQWISQMPCKLLCKRKEEIGIQKCSKMIFFSNFYKLKN